MGQELDDNDDDFDLDESEDRPFWGAPAGASQQHQRTDSSATQADLALMEAAMSSAVHHPNVVQTYHYRTVQPQLSLGGSGGMATRVCLTKADPAG